MVNTVSQEQIDLEKRSNFRPLAIESGITILPLSELGDREFEILAYLLVQKEIEESKHPNISDISLMQGVAERGRDCVLYKNGIVSGLIQCKKYKSRLTRPQTIKEILKFILFSILDKSILPNPQNFAYHLYVSNDFTEPAIKLIYSFITEIDIEIKSSKIKKYLEEIIEEYESFEVFKNKVPVTEVEKLLKSIKISSSNVIDLSSRIYKYDSILTMFFNVKKVIDLEGADKIVRKALDEYGLKFLTDDDLKSLQERVGKTHEDSRVNLGFVDFYGYNIDFFKSIKGESFKDVMNSIAVVMTTLDRLQMDYLSSKINEYVLEKVTISLLFTGKIHTFSVGVATPYLFKRLVMRLVSNSLPKELLPKYYPQFKMEKQDLIKEISEILFESSERVMKSDYSQLVGNPSDIEFKKRIYNHMHIGLKNIEVAKAVFKKDIKIILPVLDEIEDQILNLIPEEKTVIIKDGSFWESKEEMDKMLKSFKSME